MSKKLKKAYSLIELSIVILIISILITGALSVSVSSINNAKIKVTNDRIQVIYKALGNYLAINNKLPCPADITKVKSTDSAYGTAYGTCTANTTGLYVSTSTGATNLAYGMVPVKDLNLPNDMAEDGFESKFAYIIDARLTALNSTNATSGFNVGYTVASGGVVAALMNVTERPSGSVTGADFAIVSYGANKAGSFPAESATQATRSSDNDERSNDVTPAATPYFYPQNPNTSTYTLISASVNSDVFDDIVFAKKRTDIMRDFDAMYPIPCVANTFANVYGATSVAWPIGRYNEGVISGTLCTTINATYTAGADSPVRRCGAFGVWGIIISPCS